MKHVTLKLSGILIITILSITCNKRIYDISVDPVCSVNPTEDLPKGVDKYKLSNVKLLTTDGGRVDWSSCGKWIIYDSEREPEIYEVWRIKPDGSEKECLTCDHPDLPEGTTRGQPAWHPDGKWFVFQCEKEMHMGNMHSNPGHGIFHDLWIMNIETRKCYLLNEVRNGMNGEKPGGTLHAVFSNKGDKLLWTDLQDHGYSRLKFKNGLFGDWQIALADFYVDTLGIPHIKNRVSFNPGKDLNWFETHQFGPDDTWFIYSGNTLDQWELYSDINCNTIEQLKNYCEPVRLTKTSGKNKEKGYYDEIAHFTPNYDAFIWMSKEGKKVEYWMANPDGSCRRQITHFNTPGYKEYELIKGKYKSNVPADNAWNPNPSAGKQQLVAYVNIDFVPLKAIGRINYIYILEFDYAE